MPFYDYELSTWTVRKYSEVAMAGCVPPTCTSFSTPYQPITFLQTISEDPERSCLLQESHQKRPMKRKRWNDAISDGASPSKKFISEEEMTSSIQQLNLTNPPPPPPPQTTPTTTPLNKILSAGPNRALCQYCMRGKNESITNPPSSPPLTTPMTTPLNKTTRQLNIKAVSSCQSSLQQHNSKRERRFSDSSSHDVSPLHKRACLRKKKTDVNSLTFAVDEHDSRKSKRLDTRHVTRPFDHVIHYKSHVITNSRTEDNADEDEDMSEFDSGSSLLEGGGNLSLRLGSSLSLSDALKKMDSSGVSLEDVSPDSDGSNGGPERPLSVWIAPELQQTLAMKNQTDISLLPPSILNKVTIPKGMELVLWVEPEKLVKAHSQNEDDIVEMGEQEPVCEESSESLQRMESVAGHQAQLLDFDEDEFEMESECNGTPSLF